MDATARWDPHPTHLDLPPLLPNLDPTPLKPHPSSCSCCNKLHYYIPIQLNLVSFWSKIVFQIHVCAKIRIAWTFDTLINVPERGIIYYVIK